MFFNSTFTEIFFLRSLLKKYISFFVFLYIYLFTIFYDPTTNSSVSSLVLKKGRDENRKIKKKRKDMKRWKLFRVSLKKTFQLSLHSFRSRSSERKQSDGVSRCFEINCPHSEELFNESIRVFLHGETRKQSSKFLGFKLQPNGRGSCIM